MANAVEDTLVLKTDEFCEWNWNAISAILLVRVALVDSSF